MTSFDSSRVISAFDGLVEHMQTIELPPFDTFQVSETVLPTFKTLLQQYADQHNRTKKDIASLRSAWTCISSVAPSTSPQAVLESSGSDMLPPASYLPGAALDAVSDVASGYSVSELENSRQLVRQLQQQLQVLTTQYETQKEDVCTENDKLRLQISELKARLLAPTLNPSSVAKGDGGPQQQVQNDQPTLAQFDRATFNAAQRKDEAFMLEVFKRHATNEKLSASTLIAALKDVAAPLLSATSSESSSDSADFVFRRADANMSGDIDFSE
jgi:regulator of replication initiation timing